ncbi:MAG TPA: hypothetical protein VHT52_23820 [Stellaceae bacterium]|nr:hypothetical protein [Stellaceae bacterium]
MPAADPAEVKVAHAGEDRVGRWIDERIVSDTTLLSCRPTDMRLAGGGRRQSPLAAEADLRFGAAVELRISDFSPSSRLP